MGYDRGIETEVLEISRTDVRIGGDSILDLFEGEQRRVLQILIIRDFDIDKTKKLYKGKVNVEIIVNTTLEALREKLEADMTNVKEFEVFSTEE